MKCLLFFNLFLFVAIHYACNENNTALNPSEQLVGYWKLQSGQRDKVVTETLDGTWVKIDTQNQFSTNLPIADSEPVAFLLKKNIIVTKGTSQIEYAISNLTDTSLTLSFSAKGFDFDLFLLKSTPDSTYINL